MFLFCTKALFNITKFVFVEGKTIRFYGVVVSTLDFESSDLGSTPGRTLLFALPINLKVVKLHYNS